MNAADIAKGLKEHIPEILTGISVGCAVGSNIWTYKATKKYVEDKDKKHFIGPIVMAGVGAASAIGSDCLHVKGKAVLLASLAGSAALNVRQRQELEKRMTPEEMEEFDKSQNIKTAKRATNILYFMPSVGIAFWADPITHEQLVEGEERTNAVFDKIGQVSLEDIFGFLKIDKDVYATKEDPIAARHMLWTFDFQSQEKQYLEFEIVDSDYCGVPCKRFKINQYGARWNSFDVPSQKNTSV